MSDYAFGRSDLRNYGTALTDHQCVRPEEAAVESARLIEPERVEGTQDGDGPNIVMTSAGDGQG